MSNQQQQLDQSGVRKSRRQRVPNQYYTAGINQLKKNSLKQYKRNRPDQDDQYSSGDQRNNISSGWRNYQKESMSGWFPCVMMDNRVVKVQIVIDSLTNQVAKNKDEQQSKIVQEPMVMANVNQGTIKKKETSSLNLLSLFTQAIKNAECVDITPKKAQQNTPVAIKYLSAQKPKPAPILPPQKRLIQQDKDGKILSICLDKQACILQINHSKLGQLQIPIQHKTSKQNPMISQEDETKLNEWTIKFKANSNVVKTVPIFN